MTINKNNIFVIRLQIELLHLILSITLSKQIIETSIFYFQLTTRTTHLLDDIKNYKHHHSKVAYFTQHIRKRRLDYYKIKKITPYLIIIQKLSAHALQ